MNLEEIIAGIDKLKADSKRVADALHAHHRDLPPSSPDHAPLQRLHRVVADFHSVLALTPGPFNG